MSQDFEKLKAIIEILTPGLVFAADGAAFAPRHRGRPCRRTWKSRSPPIRPSDRPTTPFAELLDARADRRRRSGARRGRARYHRQNPVHLRLDRPAQGRHQHAAHAVRQPGDDPRGARRSSATSRRCSSTGCRGITPSAATTISVSCSTTAARSTSTKASRCPAPSRRPCAICATSRRRSISTCRRASRCCCRICAADRALRETFFSRLKVLFYAGAGLSQHVRDALQELAIETTGERIIFLSSLGSTETAPLAIACSWDTERVGNIGLPLPGVELKLVPSEGKLEARLKGPNITPGYWRAPALTAEAFDEEGFYKIGDALKFADPADPAKGLLFDGRLAEDFKLATGTWVSVGPLRAAFIAHCAPLVRDVVLAGADRDEIAALIFPDLDACRKLAPDLAADAPAAAVLADARIVRGVRAAPRGACGPAPRHVGARLAAPFCSPNRRRSTSARPPTKDRSTSARCSPIAPPWSKSFTPTRRRQTSSSRVARAWPQRKGVDHGYSRTRSTRHRRRLGPRRRHRAHAGAGRRQGGHSRRQPEGRRRDRDRHQRHRHPLRRRRQRLAPRRRSPRPPPITARRAS